MTGRNGGGQELVREATRKMVRSQIMKGFIGHKKFEHYPFGAEELS